MIWTDIIVFTLCGAAVCLLGSRLSAQADRLADRTGLGEALMGAVFLGASTSLPGITASIVAAADNHPALALSNAIGGIAVQTAFLAVADIAYRRANLEHAAASIPNLVAAALLISLLSMILLAMVGPNIAILGLHPITPAMLIVYVWGIRLVYQTHEKPMWHPRRTDETLTDDMQVDPDARTIPLWKQWSVFAITAVLIVVAGGLLTRSAESIALNTGLTESIVGALLLAVITSLPELVTSVAAVRRGALTLAVGGIIGGNAFDTLFAAGADAAFLEGSVYHHATMSEHLLIVVTILMSTMLMMGLLKREKKGVANIGFESFAILVLYGLAIVLVVLVG